MDGIPTVSKLITDLANDYLYRYKDSEVAINKLIKSQINKKMVNGFVMSLGGAVTLPLTTVMIPTNIISVLHVHKRMVAAIAYIIGGFDYSSTKIIEGRPNIVFGNSRIIHSDYCN